MRFHFDCEKCGAHVVSDTSPTLVCSVPVDADGHAIVTMCPDDHPRCGEVLDDPMVYWSDLRAMKEAIIDACWDFIGGTTVLLPRTYDRIIAAAEETPLQRASREVTEQQDAAAEQEQTS